jgi:beta-galactosidase GanA
MLLLSDEQSAGGFVSIFLRCFVTFAGFVVPLTLRASDMPHIKLESGTGQLIVNARPFLILGGELGNSSAGTAAEADRIVPKLAAMHVNTILMPVAWEQIEPKEGSFDFRILDHWMEVARRNNVHLVLLWFGSWKNAFSNYTPSWVKMNPKRFPRAQTPDGNPLEILSTLSAETRQSDIHAFTALMHHVRDQDDQQQTVLMVQVENEVGYLGSGRDRSPEANRLFRERVPDQLLRSLSERCRQLSPELAANFNEQGRTWSEIFGDAADEAFMTWNYATYVEAVASAGKREYALPVFVNAQLPAPQERAGEYPSGGPHPYYLEIWRTAAPSIEFYSPDIYWPNFEYWVRVTRYLATRSSFRKLGSRAHPTMLFMRTDKRAPSALVHSRSTLSHHLKSLETKNRQSCRFTNCWTASEMSCHRPKLPGAHVAWCSIKRVRGRPRRLPSVTISSRPHYRARGRQGRYRRTTGRC